MDGGVPEGPHGRRDGLIANAQRAMEDHEVELYARLLDLTRDHIPEAGSDDERREAMRKAIEADPEALRLYARLHLIDEFGGAGYLRRIMGLADAD